MFVWLWGPLSLPHHLSPTRIITPVWEHSANDFSIAAESNHDRLLGLKALALFSPISGHGSKRCYWSINLDFLCYPIILSCWHSSSSLKIPRAEVDYPLVISKKSACTKIWKSSCLLFLFKFYCDLPHSSQGLHKVVASHLLASGDTGVCLRKEGWPASIASPNLAPLAQVGLDAQARNCKSMFILAVHFSLPWTEQPSNKSLVFYHKRFLSSQRELLWRLFLASTERRQSAPGWLSLWVQSRCSLRRSRACQIARRCKRVVTAQWLGHRYSGLRQGQGWAKVKERRRRGALKRATNCDGLCNYD